MVRPLKFYIVSHTDHLHSSIVEGAKAARSVGFPWKSFDTRQAAEDYHAWWEYDCWVRRQPAPEVTGLCDRFVLSMY